MSDTTPAENETPSAKTGLAPISLPANSFNLQELDKSIEEHAKLKTEDLRDERIAKAVREGAKLDHIDLKAEQAAQQDAAERGDAAADAIAPTDAGDKPATKR